jgi:hypothetical protein
MNSTRTAGWWFPPASPARTSSVDVGSRVRGRAALSTCSIDLAQLRTWVNTSVATNATQIMYVTFTGTPVSNATKNAHSDGFRPVVRLLNATQLPNMLTIATDRSLYVKGKYNTVSWVPASLVGDAITFLAPGWTDAAHQCTAYDTTRSTLRKPSTGNGVCNGFTVAVATVDSVNAAILAGHSETPCDQE